MSPLPSDDAIITNCKKEIDPRFSWFPSREDPHLFIKYGSKSLILAEAENQIFAFKALERIPELERINIRVPEVYRVIERGNKAYIVMEFVHGQTLKDILQGINPHDAALQDFYHQIAMAIQLFLRFEIPDRVCPGPVGEGRIQHPLFKDAEASITYGSVTELEKHIEKVANYRPNNNLKVNFAKEDLCYCFSDLYEGNFIFTATGTLYVLDHQHASILPKSFMTYALEQRRLICDAIKNQIDLPRGNLEAMKAAGYYFLICGRKV